ncbi:MAG: polysaccharide lyase family 8 super-sandwich domain-containing protein [Sediminibacterium sp.]|nr:polysaccharide lyase family 8 super-sandwich domain-containing protein [Sediminibacterium sp.]
MLFDSNTNDCMLNTQLRSGNTRFNFRRNPFSRVVWMLFMVMFFFGVHAQQNADIKQIRKKFKAWLCDDSVNYADPQVIQKYNAIRAGISSLMNFSNLNLSNPGPVYNFNNVSDKSAFWSITEWNLLKLCMAYNIKGPVSNPNTYYQSPQLRDSILKAFTYLKLKGINSSLSIPPYVVPSEESVALGNSVLLRISSYAMSVFLMRDVLKSYNLFNDHIAALKIATDFCSPTNPNYTFQFNGFNSDGIRSLYPARLAYVLAQDTTDTDLISNMQRISQMINKSLKFGAGWSDCIKPDFITWHHLGPYMAAYGNNAILVGTSLAYHLDNTSYQLDTVSLGNLYNSVLTYVRMSAKYDLPRGVSGRFPGSVYDRLPELMPALAYLYACDPVKYAHLATQFSRLWVSNTNPQVISFLNDGGNSIEVSNTLGMMKPVITIRNLQAAPALSPSGHWCYPYAGASVHRRNDWMVAIKGTSKHIWHSERNANENVFGRYNSSGIVELYSSGNPVGRLASGLQDNGWDWSLLPGSTVEYRDTTDLLLNSANRLLSNEDFLTNATFGKNGVFSFQYRDMNSSSANKFRANKSVFCFGDIILCAGSNIRNADGVHPVYTTLFQTGFTASVVPTLINGTSTASFPNNFSQANQAQSVWMTDAVGNGFVYPALSYNQSPLKISRRVQKSRNSSNTATTTGSFVTSWIDHGQSPVQGAYVYAIKVNGGIGTAQLAQNFSNYFTIFRLDSNAHVVKSLTDSTYAYVVYRSQTTFTNSNFYKVDNPVVVMTKETINSMTVSLTNPNLGLLNQGEFYSYGTVGVMPLVNKVPVPRIVKAKFAGSWLLSSPNSSVTLQTNNDTTEITFTTLNGKSIEIQLLRSTMGISAVEKVREVFYAYPVPSEKIVNIYTPVTSRIKVYDVSGALIRELVLSPGTNPMSISELASGVYFIRNEAGKSVKFVKH